MILSGKRLKGKLRLMMLKHHLKTPTAIKQI